MVTIYPLPDRHEGLLQPRTSSVAVAEHYTTAPIAITIAIAIGSDAKATGTVKKLHYTCAKFIWLGIAITKLMQKSCELLED